MKSRCAILLVATLIFMGAAPALGYQLSFQPRITLGLEYTDNVFLDPDEFIPETGDGETAPPATVIRPESDLIFVTNPGFILELDGGRNSLALDYDFGYTTYEEFSDNDSWRHDLSLNIVSQLTRNTRLTLGNTFLYTEDPLGARTFEVTTLTEPDTSGDAQPAADSAPAPSGEEALSSADPTTVRSREPYWVNTADILLTHQFGPENSYFLGFNHSYREDDSLDGESSELYTPRLGLTYWFSQFWGVSVEGDYVYGEYEDSPDIRNWNGSLRLTRRISRRLDTFLEYEHHVVDQRPTLEDLETTDRRTLEDYNVYNPELGLSYDFSSDLSLTASAGYFYYDPDLTESYDGFSGLLNLTRTFRRGTLGVHGSTGYNAGYDTRADLGPSQYYEAGVAGTYRITRQVAMNAFASYRRDEYPEDQEGDLLEVLSPAEADLSETGAEDPAADATGERTDDTYGAGIGLTYTPLTWVSCNLNYGYRRVDSDESIDEYDENRVTFYITLTTPRPFRTER